jgi:ribonuclease HII
MNWSELEMSAFGQNHQNICGIDEAGRGPLAGPVFAAAVIFDKQIKIDEVNDSKKISAKKREILCEVIEKSAKMFAVAQASEQEIDGLNILKATFLAMQRCVEKLEINPDIILVDGNQLPEFTIKSQAITKGDTFVFSIAAASILAKVHRDRWMKKLDKQYPQYGFLSHKGYGTAKHIEAIKQYGPCPVHRMSFLKKILK